MHERDELNVQEAIEEAVAAFDSANLVWGQFYVNTWKAHSDQEDARARAVRAALGDAALDVPKQPARPEVRAFAASLRAARARLLDFLNALPADAVPSGVLDLPEALSEAAELLRPHEV